MKNLNFKGRKHAVTATCLLVGMFMLTSAAYANYDDARGYTNYKDAVKDLALYQNNYTADGEMSILVDGEKMVTIKGDFKLDGDAYYMRTISEENFSKEKNAIENVQVSKGGKTYYYYPKTNSYMVSDSKIDFRPDVNDPTIKKGIKFAELFADAMVGDLKNNFILESKDGDNRNYSVKVSGSQIPEVVNAGLSLMFTAANNQDMSQTSYVTYENYEKTFASYYEEQTGKKLTDVEYSESNDEFNQISKNFDEKYDDILQSKGNVGMLNVKADGTYDYYKTYDEYAKNVQPNAMASKDIMTMLGMDPYIDNAACNFTLNKDGKLTSNELQASMVGVDNKGKKHTITMKGNYKISDYGTTKVDAFDTSGKTQQK
ncbi:MAG: hypothetical protein AB9836_08120 [Aminipila sp.]